MTPGLRERKKRQTRETIVREALALFSERGYDAVTVADIAAAADISPRTFFAYFPTKEDLLFQDAPDNFARLATRLVERPEGESTVDALRAWIAELVEEMDPADPTERARKAIIKTTPSLAARHAAKISEFELLLRDGVARDLGASPGDLRPRLAASAITATLTALDELADDPLNEQPLLHHGDPLHVLDEALDFLRGGIAAMQARDSEPGPSPSHPD
jgi:AcrR family transcriptional regulator